MGVYASCKKKKNLEWLKHERIKRAPAKSLLIAKVGKEEKK